MGLGGPPDIQQRGRTLRGAAVVWRTRLDRLRGSERHTTPGHRTEAPRPASDVGFGQVTGLLLFDLHRVALMSIR